MFASSISAYPGQSFERVFRASLLSVASVIMAGKESAGSIVKGDVTAEWPLYRGSMNVCYI